MKNIIVILFFTAIGYIGNAQNNVLTIKNNTELNYVCKLHGQTRTLKLTTEMTKDTLVFHLETRGVKSSIVTPQKALKTGNSLSYNQGENAPVLYLKSNETFFMISRSAYQDLKINNSFIYNNTTYVLDPNSAKENILIDGKSVETFHVIAQIDKTEMWIAKNPDFPLIYKITKNPLGINYDLVKILDK